MKTTKVRPVVVVVVVVVVEAAAAAVVAVAAAAAARVATAAAAAAAVVVVVVVVVSCFTVVHPAFPSPQPPSWPSGKASVSRAKDPGFESGLRRDFFGVESY